MTAKRYIVESSDHQGRTEHIGPTDYREASDAFDRLMQRIANTGGHVRLIEETDLGNRRVVCGYERCR